MIELISREELYYKSSLIDHCISELQKSLYDIYGYNLMGLVEEESIQGEDPYDHLEPFHNDVEELSDFAVIGYTDHSKLDYLTHRSAAFIRFFDLLGIKRLFLMDELKCDWVHFPFSYREKREAFKSMIKKPAYNEAFILDVTDLSVVLPLFHYPGSHCPLWFFSLDTQVNLAMFLCRDANFHTFFDPADREIITSAAPVAGLTLGGIEVCRLK